MPFCLFIEIALYSCTAVWSAQKTKIYPSSSKKLKRCCVLFAIIFTIILISIICSLMYIFKIRTIKPKIRRKITDLQQTENHELKELTNKNKTGLIPISRLPLITGLLALILHDGKIKASLKQS